MKRLLYFLLANLSFLPLTVRGAQATAASLHCLSLKFNRGAEPFVFYSLDLTTISPAINGELAPDTSGVFTNYSFLFLNDELTFDDPIPGVMGLDLPLGADANDNGVPDFFEVSQGVGANSSGSFNFSGFAVGTVAASWSRVAGSRFGTCRLNFRINPFQSLGVFTHTFEVMEYAGPLSYSPGSNIATGTIDLVQTVGEGELTNSLKGPITFVKTETNRFNELTLQAGFWTNAAAQTLEVLSRLCERDPVRHTNYSGFLEFQDGELNTSADDYWLWRFIITDPNDADADGIPDFSDDPQTSLPRQPLLSLGRSSTNVLLTIHGDLGRRHEIQESSSITASNWPAILSVILTNDPQVVTLPLPSVGAAFWRVAAY